MCFFFFVHFETGAHGDEDSSDSEGWEEKEASRTHSVKFSEDSGIIDKDTPFVRQNTPHPKELKAKAHKLFAKEKNKVDDGANLDTLSEEVSISCTCMPLYFTSIESRARTQLTHIASTR